jgi:prophage maintenance system killer protein
MTVQYDSCINGERKDFADQSDRTALRLLFMFLDNNGSVLAAEVEPHLPFVTQTIPGRSRGREQLCFRLQEIGGR